MEEFDGSEIWEDERRRKELNKPGAMLFGSVKRKQRIKLDDYTGYEALYEQFQSRENKKLGGQGTVEQRVEDYQGHGPGRIVMMDRTNAGDGIYFYPEDPDFDKKAVQSVEGWGRLFNLPAELAPLLSVKGLRPRTHSIVFPKGSGNQFRLKGAPVNEIPLTREFMSAAVNMANYTKPIPQPQISGTGNQALLTKFATAAKIYVGDQPPSSIFAYNRKSVSDISDIEPPTTSFALAERLYPGKGSKNVNTKRKARINADNPTATAYRELLTKYEKINRDIKPITIGKETVIPSPVPKKEFEADVKRLLELKEALDLPGSKNQFRSEMGAFVKDGELYRWGSKGVLKPQGYENQQNRLAKQALVPVDEQFDPLKPKWGPFVNSVRQKIAKSLGLEKPEKDHLLRLENQIAIFGQTLDTKGNFVDRDPEFMNALAGELHNRGFSLGDQNLNFLLMSEEAHRTGKYSRHVISQDLTDAEVPKTLAEAEKQQLLLHDGRTIIADQKDGKYYLDGVQIKPKEIKSKGNYFFGGREYEKGQRQGLSLTTRKLLAKIKDPKLLADAYEMFATDAGAHEIMSGIQTAASFIYDNDDALDELSRQIRTENIPNMIKFLNYALTTPQFKGDPVYTKLLNRFTDKLNQNMADYFSDLRRRGSW